jgi:hypothetical protein
MRFSGTALAALMTIGSVVHAQPAKIAAPSQSAQLPGGIILASAEPATRASTQPTQPASAPAKHRIVRITTCRCGDPQVAADNPEQ